MDFKIQQTYPQASHGISKFNTITYAQNISSLILYGEQILSITTVPQQPKKKIAFKASKSETAPIIDKVSVFSLQTCKWEIKQCKGKIPSARCDYNVLQMGQCMIIYGGRSGDKYYNDIHALNTETWTWKKLFSIQNPPTNAENIFCKLNQHSACLITSNILWILHIDDVKWQLVSNQLPGSVWEKTNIQLPKNPLFCLKLSETNLLVFGEEICSRINFVQKHNISEFSCNPQTLINFERPHKISGNTYCSRSGKYDFFFASENKLSLLTYHNQHNGNNFQQNKSINLDFNLHCQILTSNGSGKQLFMMDSKGQLYSMLLMNDSQNYESHNSEEPKTTRIIQSPNQINDNTIAQEEYGQDQTSSYLVSSRAIDLKQSNSLKKIKQSSTTKNQAEQSEARKLKNQENVRVSSQIMINEGDESQMEEPSIIKEKLSVIFTHEHLKRRLLEEKVKNLEEVIKKSQKFVLLLCRYGNNGAKKRHIGQVKAMRQDLEHCVSKEAYYRKQMSANKIPKNIDRAVEQTIRDID